MYQEEPNLYQVDAFGAELCFAENFFSPQGIEGTALTTQAIFDFLKQNHKLIAPEFTYLYLWHQAFLFEQPGQDRPSSTINVPEQYILFGSAEQHDFYTLKQSIKKQIKYKDHEIAPNSPLHEELPHCAFRVDPSTITLKSFPANTIFLDPKTFMNQGPNQKASDIFNEYLQPWQPKIVPAIEKDAFLRRCLSHTRLHTGYIRG